MYYDLTQVAIGSCAPADCALSVLATVVSCQPGADHAVIDAGALALSKDPGPEWVEPRTFGRIFDHEEGDHQEGGTWRSDVWIKSLSQEHGVLNAPLPLGSRLRILPNHACLAAACFDTLHAVRGDRVVARWRIRRSR